MYSAEYSDEFDVIERMMSHVIRDEDTDEIIGILDGVPDDERQAYDQMMKEMESDVPVVK